VGYILKDARWTSAEGGCASTEWEDCGDEHWSFARKRYTHSDGCYEPRRLRVIMHTQRQLCSTHLSSAIVHLYPQRDTAVRKRRSLVWGFVLRGGSTCRYRLGGYRYRVSPCNRDAAVASASYQQHANAAGQQEASEGTRTYVVLALGPWTACDANLYAA